MTEQRYTTEEALNRILRLLKGNPSSSDVPGEYTGERLSEDHAFSQIAELLARSLPNEYVALPWMEYGQVYGVSGSVLGVPDIQWEKIPFNANGESSDRLVPAHSSNAITINDEGVYFVDFHINYILDVERQLNFRAEWNMTGQDQIRGRDSSITGSYRQVSGGGFITVDPNEAYSQNLELYVWSENGAGTMTILDAQLNAKKVY